MSKKPLKKGSGVTSSGARMGKSDVPGPNHDVFGIFEDRITDKKRYSRPEVDKLISEAMPDPTPYDEMVRTRHEFDNLNGEISHREAALKSCLTSRKECEKRLAVLIAKVKTTAEETLP